MSSPSHWLLLGCLVALTVSTAHAQQAESQSDTTTGKTDVPTRQIEFSYAYMNPVSYRGRTFGVRQWGMIPQLTYKAPSGWAAYGVGYIWNDFQTSSLGKLDLGVEKEGKLGKNLSYTLGYERWFFPGAEPGETQPLSNFLETYLSGEWNDWTPALGVYYMVGLAQLLQTDLQLSRYLGLGEGKAWSLFAEPTLKAMFANQSLLINGLYQPPANTRPRRRVVPSENRPFGLVAAELDLPITLQTARWRLVADPRLAQPYNTLSTERKTAFFYFVATLTYTLKLS